MQGLPGQTDDQFFQLRIGDRCSSGLAAIDRIADQRQVHFRKVDPDLVGSAGFELKFDQAQLVGGVALQDFPMGHGALSAPGVAAHFLALSRMAADRSINNAGILSGAPMDQGEISALDGMLLELGGQVLVAQIVFGRNDHP